MWLPLDVDPADCDWFGDEPASQSVNRTPKEQNTHSPTQERHSDDVPSHSDFQSAKRKAVTPRGNGRSQPCPLTSTGTGYERKANAPDA